jgi:uncharacterized membrane protein YhaH (DUF805 family)
MEKTEKTNFVLSTLNYLENNLLRITKKSFMWFYLFLSLYVAYQMQIEPLLDILTAHWYKVVLMVFYLGAMIGDEKSFRRRAITGAGLAAFHGALIFILMMLLEQATMTL